MENFRVAVKSLGQIRASITQLPNYLWPAGLERQKKSGKVTALVYIQRCRATFKQTIPRNRSPRVDAAKKHAFQRIAAKLVFLQRQQIYLVTEGSCSHLFAIESAFPGVPPEAIQYTVCRPRLQQETRYVMVLVGLLSRHLRPPYLRPTHSATLGASG